MTFITACGRDLKLAYPSGDLEEAMNQVKEKAAAMIDPSTVMVTLARHETDIGWLKRVYSSLDRRVWGILAAIILNIAVTIMIQVIV